jgi:hypothetical protein
LRNNIPLELRERDQWVCAGLDKKPINPRTGQMASPTDPATWGTFEEACRTGYPNVGYVLASWDPYSIIDLDNKPENPATAEQLARHDSIMEACQSYTERSTSKTGYHIIVRGAIPSGVNRDHIEMYSTGRYMICTGDTVHHRPIKDCQEILTGMYGQMKPEVTVELSEQDGDVSDMAIVEMASGAVNGEKFDALCSGDMSEYPSQSEADLALLSIIAFYTQSNEQVRRIFRMSALGKREKAQRNDTYINFALGKIRAKQPAPVDFDELKLNAQAAIATATEDRREAERPEIPATTQPAPSQHEQAPISEPVPLHGVELPIGLVGEMAQYIYSSAIRPVPEIALAAALALAAGICGRSYNISGTGLNQYLIILAKTGAGKEGAATGIDKLMSAARPTIPMIDEFSGPGSFASGQAMIKVLDTKPCFVSILGEVGLTLQQLSSPRASGSEIMLKKVFLDLYSKSGWDKMLKSTAYSDSEKNTKIVQAPNVTLLGESTPEAFFDGIDESHIAEGLIPRFSIIEYKGKRPPLNHNADHAPDQRMLARFIEMATVSLTMMNNGTCAPVSIETEANNLLLAFNNEADSVINKSSQDVECQLWNRAHLKALKLAGLIAVGTDPHNAVVTPQIAQWAITFVKKDITTVAKRFASGDVGQGNGKQIADLKSAINHFLTSKPGALKSYGVPTNFHSDMIIPYTYFHRRLDKRASFRKDSGGSTRAVQSAIQVLIDSGDLIQIPPKQITDKYKSSSKCFAVTNSWDGSSYL